MPSASVTTSTAALLESVRDARTTYSINQPESLYFKDTLDSFCMDLEMYESLMNKTPSLKSATLSSLNNQLIPCQNALNSVVGIQRAYRNQLSEAVSELAQAVKSLRQTLHETQMRKAEKAPAPENPGMCQYGESCQVQGCKFAHPETMKCRHGASCKTKSCTLTHPEAITGRNGAASKTKGRNLAHPETSNCQYGAGCKTPNCTFIHPEPIPCRHGAACKTTGCTFAHPEMSNCQYGAGCQVPGCKFSHPEPIECRNGAGCRTSGCTFTHPEPANCRNGPDCKKTNCNLAHPPPPYSKTPQEVEVPAENTGATSRQGKGNGRGNGKGNGKGRRAKSTLIPEKAFLCD